jgi:RimJ/RimL family protein N-acetyltransferase
LDSPYEGKLVRLRAREPEDAAAHHIWFNDPNVVRYLGRRYPQSVAHCRGRLQPTTKYGKGQGFSVERLDDGRCIGEVFLGSIHDESRSATLGIAIGDKASWDGGFGTDTMRTVCRFGFEMMNLHRIELHVDPENERARRVYLKVGFREEGQLRDGRFKHGGYRSDIVMGLLEGELLL